MGKSHKDKSNHPEKPDGSSNKTRGGPGKGQGRKSLSGGGESPVIRARVSPEQAETWVELGGAEWLRSALDKERKKKARKAGP